MNFELKIHFLAVLLSHCGRAIVAVVVFILTEFASLVNFNLLTLLVGKVDFA